MTPGESEADRIRDTTRWPRRWLAMKRAEERQSYYGFIDALDVAAGAEILVRGNTIHTTNALMAAEPVDGESLPVIAEFPSLDAMLAAGWQVD